jgi:probable HAF family extracellular repeat protein
VNNLGNVVGDALTAFGDFHPFFWSAANGMLDLGVLPTTDLGWGGASAINDHDEVVGGISRRNGGSGGVGFYWSQSTGMVELKTLPGRIFASVSGINNRGMIAGVCESDWGPTRAVLWESYSSMPQNLGALSGGLDNVARPSRSWLSSEALGLNNRGQVVGWSYIP